MNCRNSSESSPRRRTRGLSRGGALVLAGALALSHAQAAFHLWNLRELYTDNSGSLQFIELFCSSGGQTLLGGQSISVVPTGGGSSHLLTIPGNLSGSTANRAYLIGTAGIQAAGSPAPDFIMPDNFLFPGGGTITFFGANSGTYTPLPVDGVLSRTWGGGNAANSPQNFAGSTGVITAVPEPSSWTLLAFSGICLCLLLRPRSP